MRELVFVPSGILVSHFYFPNYVSTGLCLKLALSAKILCYDFAAVKTELNSKYK